MPIFKKEVVITSIKLNSPQVVVERLADSSINIVELFFKKPFALMGGKFNLIISRIVVDGGDITFKDRTFEEPFIKNIKNANIDIKFSPHKVNFNSDFEIPSKMAMLVKSSGEYNILKKELSVRIEAKDFYPREFIKYCDEKRFKIPDGRIDALTALDYKDNILNVDTGISGSDMKFSEGKIEASLNAVINAKIKYDLISKELIYTGTADIKNLALYNLDVLDKIYDIRGNASFSDKVFNFDNITATILGLPVKARAGIADVQKPVLRIDITSEAKLETLGGILKNKFNIDMPLEMKGSGTLDLTLQYKNITDEQTALNGSLTVDKAIFKSEYGKLPLEDVTGKFSFTQNQLNFKSVRLSYDNINYEASGTVTNFQKPGVQLDLSSDSLFVKTIFSVSDKTITLSELIGHYDDYRFSVQGLIDTADPKDPRADLNGSLIFELAQEKEPYKSFKDKFKDLRLSGEIRADFKLNGSLNDIGRSMIDAQIKCGRLSVNSFKLDNLILDIAQRNSIANIKHIRASLYGGVFEGSGLVDFASKDTPYQVLGDIKDIRIEELKRDTAFKDEDVSGTIQTHFGVKGFSNDFSRLTGWGKLSISKGKLWQLNLLRGIGTLLFRSDFGSVLFEDGSCNFFIKEKSFFINDLVMKSSLLNLYGAVKISFDKSVAASLKAEFTDEGIDASRASDIAGAIERYSIIEVKGTLGAPQYKLRPDLSNVIADIADTYFSQ
ncbi:MAG: DUF3971 domain-containing protein [Candidatus Omnitrophota bacterium]|nr:DUF3971 domain-containing protein [Candidatus Omnitrophota bacterium]